MPLSATRFALPHVGSARNQRSDPAACADPKIRGLLWGRQLGHRTVRTNDVPHLQRRHVPDLPQRAASPANARTPHDRRARQRSLSPRKTSGRLPALPCSTVTSAVPAALQPTTGSNRACVEADSAPCYAQPLLRHAGRGAQGRQRLLRPMAKAQQSASSTMLYYLRRCVYKERIVPRGGDSRAESAGASCRSVISINVKRGVKSP